MSKYDLTRSHNTYLQKNYRTRSRRWISVIELVSMWLMISNTVNAEMTSLRTRVNRDIPSGVFRVWTKGEYSLENISEDRVHKRVGKCDQTSTVRTHQNGPFLTGIQNIWVTVAMACFQAHRSYTRTHPFKTFDFRVGTALIVGHLIKSFN